MSIADDLKIMDPYGVVDRPDQLIGSADMKVLAKDIAASLDKHYRGWNWGITVDDKNGVVHIFALLLSGDMGYTLLLSDVRGDIGRRRIVIAGGEILERFGCRRGHFSLQQWQRVTRSADGVPVPDISDKHNKMKRRLVRRRALA